MGEESWGPWIEHDGGYVPMHLNGKTIRVKTTMGNDLEGTMSFSRPERVAGWNRRDMRVGEDGGHVVMFCIRRPAALQLLITIAANHTPAHEEVKG